MTHEKKTFFATLVGASLFSTFLSALTESPYNQPASNQTNPTQIVNHSSSFKYPPLTPAEIQKISNEMNTQIQANEEKARKYIKTFRDPNQIAEIKQELKGEIDFQKWLISEIKEKDPAFRSPKAQQALMHRLRKNFLPYYEHDHELGDILVRTVTLEDTYFLGRVLEAERPYTIP